MGNKIVIITFIEYWEHIIYFIIINVSYMRVAKTSDLVFHMYFEIFQSPFHLTGRSPFLKLSCGLDIDLDMN